MGKLRLNSTQVAQLKSYARHGAGEAAIVSAILDGTLVIDYTVGAEGAQAADTIRVTGQVKDLDGSNVAAVTGILLEGLQTAGNTLTITAVTGTALVGDGTTQVWIETDATGLFVVDVLLQNTGASQAGDVLVWALLDNGQVETLKLTFA